MFLPSSVSYHNGHNDASWLLASVSLPPRMWRKCDASHALYSGWRPLDDNIPGWQSDAHGVFSAEEGHQAVYVSRGDRGHFCSSLNMWSQRCVFYVQTCGSAMPQWLGCLFFSPMSGRSCYLWICWCCHTERWWVGCPKGFVWVNMFGAIMLDHLILTRPSGSWAWLLFFSLHSRHICW